jgi:hypothetical protein
VKLLLDEMLDREIAVQLRQRGHDAVALQERPELWGTPDEQLLIEVALGEGRVIVTDNLRDFLRWHAAILDAGGHHAGILLTAANRYPRAKRYLGLWVRALDAFLLELPAGPDLTDSYYRL